MRVNPTKNGNRKFSRFQSFHFMYIEEIKNIIVESLCRKT